MKLRYRFYVPIVSLLLGAHINAFAYPGNTSMKSVGGQSDILESISHKTAWPLSNLYDPNTLYSDDIVTYHLTSGYPTDEDIQLIKTAYHQGNIILIDATSSNYANTRQEATKKLIGIGLADDIIILRKGINELPEIKTIEISDDATLTNTLNAMIAEKVIEKISDWRNSRSSRVRRDTSHYSNSISRVIQTVPLHVEYIGFSCDVGNGDSCSYNQSNASMFYELDFIRSLPSVGSSSGVDPDENGLSHINGSSDDAKYFRITYNPQASGGSGWFIANKPSHKHTWFQSYANRKTWFGPFVDKYTVEIRSNGNASRLFNSIPGNKGKDQQIREVSGITIGVNAKLGADKDGPKAGVGAEYTYSSQKWVIYDNKEYEIANLSTYDSAKWEWDRKAWQNRLHLMDCSSNFCTAPIWSSGWVFQDKHFSSASHAGYKPGFSATFRVDGTQSGTEDFTILNEAKVAGLEGRVTYAMLWSSYTPEKIHYDYIPFRKTIRIDWDSPIFNLEPTFAIRSKEQRFNDQCLTVPNQTLWGGERVNFSACDRTKTTQSWIRDRNKRFKVANKPELCLAGFQNLSLVKCSNEGYQKWDFNNDQLVTHSNRTMIIFGNQPAAWGAVSTAVNEGGRWVYKMIDRSDEFPNNWALDLRAAPASTLFKSID